MPEETNPSEAVTPLHPAQPTEVKTPTPSLTDQAVEQSKQALKNGEQATQQATAKVQEVTAQTQQVAGEAKQMFGQATQVLSSILPQEKTAINSTERVNAPGGKPAQPQPTVTSDEKIWGAFSYIPMVALLALLLKPHSEFIKLHGRQGLLIFGIFFATIFLYIIVPPLGAILGGLIQLALFVIGIYSLVQAFMGNWWKIPVLGDIAEKLPIEAFTKATTVAITGQPPATPLVDEQEASAQVPPPPTTPTI